MWQNVLKETLYDVKEKHNALEKDDPMRDDYFGLLDAALKFVAYANRKEMRTLTLTPPPEGHAAFGRADGQEAAGDLPVRIISVCARVFVCLYL